MRFIAGDKRFEINERPIIMGVLNVTPDSFYDGGKYNTVDAALVRAEKMISDGADIIDVGGESTRPGSLPIDEEEEKRRILPVIEGIVSKFGAAVSVDTYKPDVARAALQSGAVIINDIFALRYKGVSSDGSPILVDENDVGEMAGVAREFSAGVILMHIKGTPRDMQVKPPEYPRGVIFEIKKFLETRAEIARREGIPAENIAVDPGIGFGKQPQHNVEIIKYLGEFKSLGVTVLIGASRKSFLGAILDKNQNPSERLGGTIAAHFAAYMAGARILRVHDVKEHRDFFDAYIKITNYPQTTKR